MDNLPDCCYDYRYEVQTPKIVDNCNVCGYEIFEGEDYYKICNMKICENCIDDFKKIAE